MATCRRSRKLIGGEQLAALQPTVPISDILEDFQLYNQLLQEECYLVFRQLQASGELLSSPSVSAYMEEFGDNSFAQVKQTYDALMNELISDEFIQDTLFFDASNASNVNASVNASGNTSVNASGNVSVVTGGARGFDIDLSNITPDTVKTYTYKQLTSTIKKYQPQHDRLSAEEQEKLALCVAEHQMQAMTSQNKLYLGDVSISCMLYNQFKNIVGAAHKAVTEMPINKKVNILQNLFADLLKWGGKQVMLRLRAPEFDVTAVSDMASFKEEVLKFIGNRISQIMEKSKTFRDARDTVESKNEHLKWVLSIIENIDSLLSFVKVISQLSMMSTSPDFNVKVNVRASMSTGVKVNIETNQWLQEIGESVGSLKDIVTGKKDLLNSIAGPSIDEIIKEGRETKAQRERERQLKLLDINIQAKDAILAKNPNNYAILADKGRLEKLRDKLREEDSAKNQEIEYTCVQLLQEIHMLVSSMEIPNVPLDVFSKKILQELATKVDHSAFASVIKSVSRNVASEVSKVDVGLRTYFGCIGKYMDFVPNISNICNHIGFRIPDLHNVIAKLGTISGVVSNVASQATIYVQAVNVCLLIIHLIVAASLNCRNKTLNKERLTLADINRGSQERIEAKKPSPLSSSVSSLPKIGVRGGKLTKRTQKSKRLRGGNITLPPLRHGLVDRRHEMPFFVQGRKAVLNERIKQHTIELLSPKNTTDKIMSIISSKYDPQNTANASQHETDILENVNKYIRAYQMSLDNNRSVLDNLRPEITDVLQTLNTTSVITSTCNAIPAQLSSEEDMYVLSMLSAYQGQQLRNAFNFTALSQKPSQDSLYCKVTQNIYLDDYSRLQKIITSIVTNFNGDTMIGGGSKNRKKHVESIQRFLDKKTKEELYAYASSKELQVKPSMSKRHLIQVICDMK